MTAKIVSFENTRLKKNGAVARVFYVVEDIMEARLVSKEEYATRMEAEAAVRALCEEETDGHIHKIAVTSDGYMVCPPDELFMLSSAYTVGRALGYKMRQEDIDRLMRAAQKEET